MRLKLMLVMIFGIVLLSSVNAALCYQEHANVSTDCGGINTGKYATSGTWWAQEFTTVYLYDGNWTNTGLLTYQQNSWSYLNINYSIPNIFGDQSWQIRFTNNSLNKTENFTIPAACLTNGLLQLRIADRNNAGATKEIGLNFSCMNGSDWYLITQRGTTLTSEKVYEEAMIWNIYNLADLTPLKNYWLHLIKFKNLRAWRLG